jgi:hypothetical protein
MRTGTFGQEPQFVTEKALIEPRKIEREGRAENRSRYKRTEKREKGMETRKMKGAERAGKK